MDVNSFFHELFIDSLGLDVLGMEDRFPELIRLVDRRTLPAFSNMIGAKYITYLDLADRASIIRKDYHTEGIEYQLGDPMIDKFHLPILSVEDVKYNNVSGIDPNDPNSTSYYNQIITSRQNMTIENVLFGSEYTYNTTVIDNATPFKPYKEYRGGKVLYLLNWGYQGVVQVIIKTKWPNIVSIPEEYHEWFRQLAEYDIKIKLWNELRYIEDVVTPKGNLQLRFDWSSAAEQRDEFLEKFRIKSHPDRVGARYFQLL